MITAGMLSSNRDDWTTPNWLFQQLDRKNNDEVQNDVGFTVMGWY